jgi:hypothetical protein
MSRLQNTVRDKASCRRHGPRRARGPGRQGARQCRPGHAPEMRVTAETVIRALAEDDGNDALHMEESDQ